jgi:hypothetical protein
MTKDQTLNGRIEELQALGCYVSDKIIICPMNRKLDINEVYLKHLTKYGFTKYLESVQEVYKEKRT